MRWEFWARALGPLVALCAAICGVCALAGSAPWLAPLLTGAQLAVWYWTDLLLTDRVKGHRLVRESAEYVDTDGQPKTDHELTAWSLLAVLFLGSNLLLLTAGSGTLTGIWLLCLHLPLLACAIYRS